MLYIVKYSCSSKCQCFAFFWQTITFKLKQNFTSSDVYFMAAETNRRAFSCISGSLIETSNPLICSIDTTYVLVIQRECLMWKAALSATRVITPATCKRKFIVSAVDFRYKTRLNVSCKRSCRKWGVYLQTTQPLILLELFQLEKLC